MAMADFTPNYLSVNTAGLMREIESAIDICLDELSYMFQELLIRQMRENGNGSSIMKDEAVTHVKEISRRVGNTAIGHISGEIVRHGMSAFSK